MDELETKIANTFLSLFDGNQDRYLALTGSPSKDDNGKVTTTKTRLMDGALTPEMVMDHIKGDASYGVAPVRADSTCCYGVLDIDWPDMPEDDVRGLADRLRTRCAAFRSKSLGLHIYVFASEPISAREMHDYLVVLRKRLPKSCFDKKAKRQVEVFPKATQIVVNPGDKPTSVNLPLRGQQRELAWFIDHEGVKWALDEMGVYDILSHIDANCRVNTETIKAQANEQPVLDTSDIGYRIPDDPAGRNDLLMRIAASMQARGWPDTDMDAEIRRLNQQASRFHEVFIRPPGSKEKEQLTESEIVNLLKSAKKREKGTPTPLHYRMVEKFNREWAVIDLNGKIEYLRKSAPEFTTYSRDDLMAKTAAQRVQYGKSQVPIAKLWIEDPDRAEYEGVVCEPEGYDGPGHNVFRGFKCAPRDGDATVFKEYVLDVLCGGDADLAHWVTMWLADAVQRPTEPSVPTAIALRGPQGAGKSFLQEKVLGSIFHDRQITVVHESSRLFSQFNRSLFGCTIVACEESIFHGSKKDADTLKSFISSPGWSYEEKFKATFRAKNVHRLIATTNNEHAVHVERDDRRWTVIEVAQPFDMTTKEGQDQAYAFWEPYHAFIRSDDGPGIILRYLLDYPVDKKALTFAYGTAAKARDKVMSDPVIAVLHEIAEDGYCPDDVKAAGVVSVKTLMREVHKKPGGRRMGAEEIAARVDRLIPFATNVRNAQHVTGYAQRVDDGMVTVKAVAESRQRGRQLGALAEFRDAAAHITQADYADGKEEWHAWCPPDDVHDAEGVGVGADKEDIPF
ncbi:hypothetical protein KBY31_17100 [Ruegeria pomeroyi]|nr:hypothetical protein [Ruegeria pomeroyi]